MIFHEGFGGLLENIDAKQLSENQAAQQQMRDSVVEIFKVELSNRTIYF